MFECFAIFEPNFKNFLQTDSDSIKVWNFCFNLKSCNPNSYDIFYREKRLESFRKIIEINLQENDILAIKGVGASCNCLLI